MAIFCLNSTKIKIRTLFLAMLCVLGVGTGFAGETFVIDGDRVSDNIADVEMVKLAGMPHVVITTTDADGDVTETVIVTDSATEAAGGSEPGNPSDPDGNTKRGGSAGDDDAVTIRIPRNTKGPVILIVDGQVVVVPTHR